MKRRKWALIAAGILVYVIMITMLVISEKNFGNQNPEYRINSPQKAIWFSAETLTTVGYGDMYPSTPVGRLIALLMMLFSLGFLAYLITQFLVNARILFKPRLLLWAFEKKNWYLFDDYNSYSIALARDLLVKMPDCVVIFCETPAADVGKTESGYRMLFSIDEVQKLHKEKGRTFIFFMSGNIMKNYAESVEQVKRGVPACCMTEYEPQHIPKGLTLFSPYQCCARLYWKQYPVCAADEKIVLIGKGKYGRAILEQGILVNIISSEQHIEYIVYGGASDFEDLHPYLGEVLSVNHAKAGMDSILFKDRPWYKELDIIQGADRIIIAEDDENHSLDILCKLRRYCPFSGSIHIRKSDQFENETTFGKMEDVFTIDIVLQQKLNQSGIALHEIYRKKNPEAGIPEWDDLSAFLQRSNLAAADHLDMKLRILLGEKYDEISDIEKYACAFKKYNDTKAEKAGFYRKIEHERWMRFHSLYNWRYSEERDNERRLHPLMIPFESLSEKEQEKDDGAWLLLEEKQDVSCAGLWSDRR